MAVGQRQESCCDAELSECCVGMRDYTGSAHSPQLSSQFERLTSSNACLITSLLC